MTRKNKSKDEHPAIDSNKESTRAPGASSAESVSESRGDAARERTRNGISRRDIVRAGWTVPIVLALPRAAQAHNIGSPHHHDAPHQDAHFDQHLDNPAHYDLAHHDAHGDYDDPNAHCDAHIDAPHEDAHEDFMHVDLHGDEHSDCHGDVHQDLCNPEHGDLPHQDLHDDASHADHTDTTVHADVSCDPDHIDYAHVDNFAAHFDHTDSSGGHGDHTDILHSDIHFDGDIMCHGDGPHADAHDDSHIDCPHQDQG